jgi:hypothetical protein
MQGIYPSPCCPEGGIGSLRFRARNYSFSTLMDISWVHGGGISYLERDRDEGQVNVDEGKGK